MKKTLLFSLLLLSIHFVFSQAESGVHELHPMNDLLTEEVKMIIDSHIRDKQTVFLGESTHYSGSDFLAKTEFIKYLVLEHGYKDIAFESDFFALLFDHDKRNLYSMWSKSNQCKELFDFLAKQKVTLWGFDNKMYSKYTYQNFTKKLSLLLQESGLELNEAFIMLTRSLIKNQYESRKELSKTEISFLKCYTSQLQNLEIIKTNEIWSHILRSFKTTIDLYTIKDDSSDKKRNAIRDQQMAKNLDFLVKTHPDKKFLVWSANGHMSKSNSELLNGQTMGYQFRSLQPNSSYHIAFGSIKMPERTDKEIRKAAKKNQNILSILPSLDQNYFVDIKKMLSSQKELQQKIFNDLYIFNLPKNKVKLLNHFDALVFIAKGEVVRYD